MLSPARGSGKHTLKVLAGVLGILGLAGSPVSADEHGHVDFSEGRFTHDNFGQGTLGWAEYGLYPGLYGFSLRWHPGYGYGRYALGVGADGGYPFYGGPGYPHDWPRFRRFGPAAPVAYFGSPDYPCFGDSNYYQGIGGLAIEKPVVTVGKPGDPGYVGENGDVAPGRGFGPFTGARSQGPVRSVIDANVQAIPVNLPRHPVSTERPSFLPPVGNGPPPASR